LFLFWLHQFQKIEDASQNFIFLEWLACNSWGRVADLPLCVSCARPFFEEGLQNCFVQISTKIER
jgi:hypothetical protein